MANQEMIRIRLKAYDHQLIDSSAAKIVDTAKRNGAARSLFCGRNGLDYDKPPPKIIHWKSDEIPMKILFIFLKKDVDKWHK